MLSFSKEATSETYGLHVSFHHIFLCDIFSLAFIFRSIKPKIQKYLAAIYSYLFYFAFNLSMYDKFTSRPFPILRRRSPKGIDNPFNTSGCEVLFFVDRVVYILLLCSPTGSITLVSYLRKKVFPSDGVLD